MRTEHATAFRVWTVAVDAVAVAATWIGIAHLRAWIGRIWTLNLVPGSSVLSVVTPARYVNLSALVVLCWLLALYMVRSYDDANHRWRRVVLGRLFRASILAAPLLIFLLFALQVQDWEATSRSVVGLAAIAMVPALYVGRLAMWRVRTAWLADRADHRLLVIGAPEEAAPFLESLFRHAEWGIRVVGVVVPEGEEITSVLGVKRLGTLKNLPQILTDHAIDQVYMTGRAWDTATLRRVADACEEVGTRFSMDANFLGLSISAATLYDFGGWSVLSFSSAPSPSLSLLVKRWMDVGCSALALLVLSPLLAATALAIRLEDRGPVLFTQERCGLYGRRFKMYKFRSMVLDAEARLAELSQENEMGGPVFKMKRDPRVTRVGAFIRKYSIDELPQLFNILKGEMSIVGPRPPIPAEVARYARWQMRRLSMRPGLTCIWQVAGRNEIVDFDTWMRLDLEYIDNWSLVLDLRLIALTFPVVLRGTGAR